MLRKTLQSNKEPHVRKEYDTKTLQAPSQSFEMYENMFLMNYVCYFSFFFFWEVLSPSTLKQMTKRQVPDFLLTIYCKHSNKYDISIKIKHIHSDWLLFSKWKNHYKCSYWVHTRYGETLGQARGTNELQFKERREKTFWSRPSTPATAERTNRESKTKHKSCSFICLRRVRARSALGLGQSTFPCISLSRCQTELITVQMI